MRPSSSVSTFFAALATLVLPAALAAQTASAAPAASRPPGCRGTTANTNAFTIARDHTPPVVFPSYPEIEDVYPGSPAEAAGMKRGDKIILQGGRDVIANPPPPQPFVARVKELYCGEGSREVGDEEPYLVIASVDMLALHAGLLLPKPAVLCFRSCFKTLTEVSPET